MTGTTPRELLLPRYVREDPAVRTPVGFPDYRSTALRAPLRTPVDLPHRLTEVTGPLLGEDRVTATDADLTQRLGGEAVGQRIIVHGRVLDSDGRPVPNTLVEVWQANAAGRYRHVVDNWPAPLDRPPALLETSTPGVFAAGDVRQGSVKRVASAVGEGALAVTLVHAHLAELAVRT